MADAGSSIEYNEDEIVGLVVALYKALIRIGGLEESDVLWAPAEGHPLDFSSLQDEARIDMRVVSLMQKLPIMKEYEHNQILPLMYAVNYRSAHYLAISRDIDETYVLTGARRMNMANALSTVLVLFRARDRDDCTLIPDVADNTVREMDGAMDPPDTYLDLPKQHAPTYLRSMLDRYEAGYLIADMSGGVADIGPDSVASLQIFKSDPFLLTLNQLPYRRLHRVLVEDYGWPGDFRREEWKRDVGDMVERAIKEWTQSPPASEALPQMR